MKKICLIALALFMNLTHAQALKQGGNSGGGGNLTMPSQLSEDDIKQFVIEVVPKMARLRLNYILSPVVDDGLDANASGTPEELQRMEKLIKESRALLASGRPEDGTDIFSILEKTHFNFQDTPCFDPVTGDLKDASADRATLTICYDLKSIREKTNAGFLYSYLFALAMHEYSHLMGTDEPQAKMVELTTVSQVVLDGPSMMNLFATPVNDDDWQTADARISLGKLIDQVQDTKSLSDEGLAFALFYVFADVTHLVDVNFSAMMRTHLSKYSVDAQIRFMTVVVRIQNFQNFLGRIPAAREFKGVDPLRPQDKGPWEHDRTIAEMNQPFIQDYGLQDRNGYLQARIRDLSTGNRVAIEQELRTIRDDLAQIFASKEY